MLHLSHADVPGRRERFVKDNRLLPDGFDKSTVKADIAVQGDAARDADFGGGSDRIG